MQPIIYGISALITSAVFAATVALPVAPDQASLSYSPNTQKLSTFDSISLNIYCRFASVFLSEKEKCVGTKTSTPASTLPTTGVAVQNTTTPVAPAPASISDLVTKIINDKIAQLRAELTSAPQSSTVITKYVTQKGVKGDKGEQGAPGVTTVINVGAAAAPGNIGGGFANIPLPTWGGTGTGNNDIANYSSLTSINSNLTNLFALNATTTNLSAINLTVTGTATVPGFISASSSIGALNLPGLTQGSVPFIGSGNALSENNSKLFWDNTNARLGVGTSTPQAKLHVYDGTLLVDGRVNPVVVGTSAANFGEGTPVISGKYAYIPAGANLNIVDISTPTNPVLVSNSITPTSFIESTAVSGAYLYVLDGRSVRIFDIKIPTTPVQVGVWNQCGLGTWGRGLIVRSNKAYVTCGTRFFIIDVAVPANPVTLANFLYSTGGGTAADSVYIRGNIAYVNGSAGLQVMDISTPSNPLLIGTYALSMSGAYHQTSITVSGKYAYLINKEVGITIVDVSNPAAPTLVGAYADSNVYGGSLSGKYIYISKSTAMDIVDVSSLTAPKKIGTVPITFSGNNPQLAVSGKYVYTNDGNVVDIGGLDATGARIGSLTSNSLFVSESADILDSLSVGGGLNVGAGGIFSNGPLSVSLASSTSVNEVSAYFQGLVGIGTTSPKSSLAVVGTINMYGTSSTSTSNYLNVNAADQASTTALNPGLLVYRANGSGGCCTYGMDLGYSSIAANYRTRIFTPSYADIAFSYTNGFVEPTGQSSFTDMMVIKTGGNVGIATSSPFARLDVVGPNNVNTPLFQLSSSVSFATTSRFLVSGAGNVGIGTTSPFSKLSISGNFGETNTTLLTVASSSATTTTTSLFTVLSNGTVGIGTSTPLFGQGSGASVNPLDIYTPGDTINSISIRNPSTGVKSRAGVTVFSDTANLLIQTYSSTNNQGLGFSNLTAPNFTDIRSINSSALAIRTTSTPAPIVFGTNALERMRIDGVGNVSVASNTPYAKFSVTGESTATTTLALRAFSGQTANIIDIWNGSGVLDSVMTSAGNLGLGTSTPNTKLNVWGNLSIATGSTPAFLVNTANGFVGIGTSSPATKLTVQDGIVTIRSTATTDASLPIFSAVNDTGKTAQMWMANSASAFHANSGFLYGPAWQMFADGNSGNGDISFYTNTAGNWIDVPKVIFTNTGNVGVGTSTPNNKIDIYSTTKAGLGFSGASGDTYKWTIGEDVSDAGKFKISSSTALGTSDRLVINGGGLVGIGTSSPFAKLSISANTADANTTIFNISSSTAIATTSLFSVLNNGNVGVGTSTNQFLFSRATGILTGVPNTPTLQLGDLTGANSLYGQIITSTGPNHGSALEFASRGFYFITDTSDAANNTVRFNTNSMFLLSGNANQDSTFTIQGGDASARKVNIRMVGASNNGTNPGGNVTILGGNGSNSSVQNGGNVYIAPGTGGSGGGVPGNIIFGYDGVTPVGGNLGIGTTTPFAKLSLSANVFDTNTTIFNISSSTPTATTTLFSVGNTGNIASQGNIVFNYTNTVHSILGSNGPANSSNGGDGITIAAGSGSGACCSNPGGTLTLTAGNPYTNSSTIVGGDVLITAGDNQFGRPDLNGSIKFFAGDGLLERLRINGDTGNVGVGTSSPFAKFSISANALDTNSTIFNISSSTAIATSSLFAVLNSGNVGIGTANPGARLQASNAGTGQLDGALVASFVGNNSAAFEFTNNAVFNLNNGGYTTYGGDINFNAGEAHIVTTGSWPNRVLTLNTYGGNIQLLPGGLNAAAKTLVVKPGANSTNSFQVQKSDATPVLTVDTTNGFVGIGTTTPATALGVFGDVRVGNSGTNGCIQRFDGAALTGSCTSDANLKTNITYMNSLLEKVTQLKPATYSWNELAANKYKYAQNTKITGLIAQDVEQVFPELVATNTDGFKTVDTAPLLYYNLAATAELNSALGDFTSSSTTGEIFSSSMIFNRILDALAYLGVKIDNGVATFQKIFVKEAVVEKLCVGDTCITETDLKRLLDNGAIAPTIPSTPPPVVTDTPPVIIDTPPTDASLTPPIDTPPPVEIPADIPTDTPGDTAN